MSIFQFQQLQMKQAFIRFLSLRVPSSVGRMKCTFSNGGGWGGRGVEGGGGGWRGVGGGVKPRLMCLMILWLSFISVRIFIFTACYLLSLHHQALKGFLLFKLFLFLHTRCLPQVTISGLKTLSSPSFRVLNSFHPPGLRTFVNFSPLKLGFSFWWWFYLSSTNARPLLLSSLFYKLGLSSIAWLCNQIC